MTKRKFTIKDYINMGKARGIKLPLQYFFENHLFDILNKTNTHQRLEKEDYSNAPKQIEQGILYMSSLTSEIKNALQIIKKRTGNDFKKYQFIDLGCGKGKSILVYNKFTKNKSLHPSLGIEYYSPLVKVAKQNLKTLKQTENSKIICDDAGNFSKYTESNYLILFLYNPFGEKILKRVVSNIQKDNVFIIYNDPAHKTIINNAHFKTIYSKKGIFPNRCIDIFERIKHGSRK